MTFVDFIAVIITIIGLAAAVIARRIWLMVEGDLEESWRWIIPSVPIYAISFIVLVMHNFLQKFGVAQPVFRLAIDVRLTENQAVFNMQIWEPIILVLANIHALSETLFLVLVLVGLIRQYRLFETLADKQNC